MGSKVHDSENEIFKDQISSRRIYCELCLSFTPSGKITKHAPWHCRWYDTPQKARERLTELDCCTACGLGRKIHYEECNPYSTLRGPRGDFQYLKSTLKSIEYGGHKNCVRCGKANHLFWTCNGGPHPGSQFKKSIETVCENSINKHEEMVKSTSQSSTITNKTTSITENRIKPASWEDDDKEDSIICKPPCWQQQDEEPKTIHELGMVLGIDYTNLESLTGKEKDVLIEKQAKSMYILGTKLSGLEWKSDQDKQIKHLETEMLSYARDLEFEKAATVRDQIQALHQALINT